MKSALRWLARSMDEDPGQPSALRVIVFIGCMVSVDVPAFLWIASAWIAAAHDAAVGASTFFGTVLGALLGAKIWQKSQENKS